MPYSWLDLVKQITGELVVKVSPLSEGCVGQVYGLKFQNRPTLVAKVATETNLETLETEGRTLIYLEENSTIPVPKVVHNSEGLLLLEFIKSDLYMTVEVQRDCARHFLALHECSSDGYGFEFDTVIGGIYQPNSWSSNWLDFYAEQRIQCMAKIAREKGNLSSSECLRIEKLCYRLDKWLLEPEQPSLLHGDAWSGNILCKEGRLRAVIDPACYYGHPEVELAFTTMFNTFNEEFFDEYERSMPLREGFFEERRDLYLIYPILVHIALFGGSYNNDLARKLSRYNC